MTCSPQIAEWVIGTWLMARHNFLDFAGYKPTGSAWAHRLDHMGEDSTNTRMYVPPLPLFLLILLSSLHSFLFGRSCLLPSLRSEAIR